MMFFISVSTELAVALYATDDRIIMDTRGWILSCKELNIVFVCLRMQIIAHIVLRCVLWDDRTNFLHNSSRQTVNS